MFATPRLAAAAATAAALVALALSSSIPATLATADLAEQGSWASEVLAMSGPSPQVETPPGFAGASFTCVTTADASRGSCFVSTCLQLVGAVRSGAAHITLYRNLTRGAEGFRECDFPFTITR